MTEFSRTLNAQLAKRDMTRADLVARLHPLASTRLVGALTKRVNDWCEGRIKRPIKFYRGQLTNIFGVRF